MLFDMVIFSVPGSIDVWQLFPVNVFFYLYFSLDTENGGHLPFLKMSK